MLLFTDVKHSTRIHWLVIGVILTVTGLSKSVLAQSETQLAPYADNPSTKPQPSNGIKQTLPDFEFLRLKIHPSILLPLVKPRHWTSLIQELRSNAGDFEGQLGTGFIELNLPSNLPYRVRSVRPALLNKQQGKPLELPVFIPTLTEDHRVPLSMNLYPRTGSSSFLTQNSRIVTLSEHQFFFVVLSDNSESYSLLLRNLPSMAPLINQGSLEDPQSRHYRLATSLSSRDPAPIPNHPLAWSPIAYLLWDNYDPNRLTKQQQMALLDWLHWGGQLIVCGHNSILQLQDSFLTDYLPAQQHGAVRTSLPSSFFQTFPGPSWLAQRSNSNNADVSEQNSSSSDASDTSLLLSQLTTENKDANALVRTPDGTPLVIEQKVGRGRIVICAFRLIELPVEEWSGFDHFFNASLLRRPGREPLWNTRSPSEAEQSTFHWFGWHQGTLCPRWNTQVRYFTRDTLSRRDAEENTDSISQKNTRFQNSVWLDQYRGPRTAEWDSLNTTSSLARHILHSMSGIKIPSPSFVLQILASYIMLVIPINWIFFRLIGKVEWAWYAVPVIAICFAFIMLQFFYQDIIGFRRAVQEISILEAYPGHPRSHVTRYSSIYSSERSRFAVSYREPSTVALPFPTTETGLRDQQVENVTFHWEAPVRLANLFLHANSLAMVHAEQIYPLLSDRSEQIGFFEWQPTSELDSVPNGTLTNNTQLTIENAMVFQPNYGFQHIGTIPAGTQIKISLSTNEISKLIPFPNLPAQNSELSSPIAGEWTDDRYVTDEWIKEIRQSLHNQSDPLKEGADLFTDLAISTCPSNELRLIGWSRKPLPGQSVTPEVSLHKGLTFFILHLQSPPLPKDLGLDTTASISHDETASGND